jgi:Alternative oxidase
MFSPCFTNSPQKTNIPHALKSQLPVAFTINPDTSEFHDNSSVWSEAELHSVKVTHKPPVDIADKIALSGVRFLRWSFDWLAGFKTGAVSEDKYLNRVIFLETVAGIPGMVAGSLRHLSSLRRMKRDHGWIHTLLEESENERMHLLTFLYLKKPGPMFRGAVAVTQVRLRFCWLACCWCVLLGCCTSMRSVIRCLQELYSCCMYVRKLACFFFAFF